MKNQTAFDFSDKPETPDLNLNHLDYKQLSGHAEFNEKLMSFNNKYDMSLVATKSARWQPGTYDKIKAGVAGVAYPHWKRRRGANSINKLLERNRYSYSNFKSDISKLDDMLYHYRADGIELYGDDDLAESKVLLSQLLEKFTEPIEDMEISIEPIPHFGRRLRGYAGNTYDDVGTGKTARLYPHINQDNVIVGSYNTTIYDTFDRYQDISKLKIKSTNPSEWFVNVRVAIRDIDIIVTNSEMTKEYAKLPYGDLIVSFTVDLVTLLSGYRRALNKQTILKTDFIGVTATKFPKHEAIEHPFVYTLVDSRDKLSHFNTYATGNACLGELSKEIYTSLVTGNFLSLKSYLNIWASSFSTGVTSPLNGLQQCHFGVPREWDDTTRAIIPGDSNQCRKQIKRYNTQEEKAKFCEDFCSNCAISERCRVYGKLTLDKTCWIDDCDKDFAQAYSKLQYHLKDEVDEKQVYEMFADLWYYKNNTFNTHAIRKVFGVAFHDAHDMKDFTSYLNNVIADGINMDNIIEVFERCQRAYVMQRMEMDNLTMHQELINKTADCNTYQEVIAILTIRELEDNHYSWLYASGAHSNRSDYYTYTSMLNGRREGVRYED
mgnify:FL=1